MNKPQAQEILDKGIMITADKNLTVKDLADHFTAKGYLEALAHVEPVIEKARHALMVSRAANNKTELWEAWADNLEQELKNVLGQYDALQRGES